MRGFTLIELMIVIVIISILSSIAIPAYSDYVVRAKVTELITSSISPKLAINDYIMAHGRIPNNNEIKFAKSSSQFIEQIKFEDGALHIVGHSATLGLSNNEHLSLVFIPSKHADSILWECKSIGNSKYIPITCKEAWLPAGH